MRRTMSQAGQSVGTSRRDLLWLPCALVLVVGLMLVLVSFTHGRANQHKDHDWRVGRDVAATGASRSMGGNNKTLHRFTFPWIIYFYRNPDPQFKVPMDGYLTGFGLEIAHNLLFINKDVVARATKRDPVSGATWMMAARRVMNTPLIDPSKSQWPSGEGAHMGVLDWVGDVTPTWAVYWIKSIANDQLDNWRRDTNRTYCGLPGLFRYSDCGELWPEFPRHVYLDYLDDVCYAYTISAIDWKAANKYATNYGLPAYPGRLVDANPEFIENEMRYFSRWPVKIGNCWEKNGTVCEFVFDEERWQEDYMVGKYNTRRVSTCGTYQDVGAPIMCGGPLDLGAHFYKGYQGVYYERFKMRLAFVIEPPDNVDPTKPVVKGSNCNGTIIARKLTPYYDRFQEVTATVSSK